MSLNEIVRRFVKRESLPMSKEGLYEERFGDLEKLAKADLVEQMERVEQLKSQIAAYKKRVKEDEERRVKVKADMDAAAKAVTPVGEQPVKTPPLQGS